jgi:hypothetical protein
LAPSRRGRFRLGSPGAFLRAELRDAFDQFHGDGLEEREPDGALTDLVQCKVGLERFDDALGGGVERVVLFPPSEEEHAITVQFVRRDLVGNGLLGSGQGLADSAPHAIEYALYAIGLRGDVFVNRLEIGLHFFLLPSDSGGWCLSW